MEDWVRAHLGIPSLSLAFLEGPSACEANAGRKTEGRCTGLRVRSLKLSGGREATTKPQRHPEPADHTHPLPGSRASLGGVGWGSGDRDPELALQGSRVMTSALRLESLTLARSCCLTEERWRASRASPTLLNTEHGPSKAAWELGSGSLIIQPCAGPQVRRLTLTSV